MSPRGLSARAPRGRAAVPGVPLPLGLLLAFVLLQGVLWAVATPPLEGPDEAAHAAYVQHLAETGHAPKRDTGTGSAATAEIRLLYDLNLYPIQGHLDGRPTWSRVAPAVRAIDALPPSARKDGSGPNAVAQNPPLYYAGQAVVYRLSPFRGILGRLFAMRLANVVLTVGVVLFAWLAAAELFAAGWVRFTVAAAVAFHPKLASLSANVNPDTLLILLGTAFAWLGFRVLRRGPTTRSVVALSTVCGLAALTHGRGLYLVPPLAITLAIAAWRSRPSWPVVLKGAAVATAIPLACLVVAYFWTSAASDAGGFGGEVSQATGQAFSVSGFLSYLWQFFLPKLGFMSPMLGPPYGYRQAFIETFFGGFSYFEVNFSKGAYDLLQDAVFAGFIGLLVIMAVRWRAVWANRDVVLVALVTVGSLLGLLLVSSYRDLQTGGDPLITGRYLLEGIAFYGLAIAWVLHSLPRSIGRVAAAGLVAAFFVLDVHGLVLMSSRFYG